MRQTAEHRSYIGSRAVLSRHGPTPVGRVSSHRHGFTLVEVVVAVSILFVVSVAFLRFSVTSYEWGQNLVIRSMAQNLAELTGEQLAGASLTEIDSMINVTTKAVSPDFPPNGTIWPWDLVPAEVVYPESPSYVAPAAGTYFARIPGEFLVSGITSFFPRSVSDALTQESALSSTGTPSALEALPTQFLKSSGLMRSDLKTTFPFSLGDVASEFYTYRYSVAPNIVVEPIKHENPDNGTMTWDAGLVLYRGQFPSFLREIAVESLFDLADKPTDPTQIRYRYTVNVVWLFGGKKQMVSLSGERSGVY